jgi:hypothetical protein
LTLAQLVAVDLRQRAGSSPVHHEGKFRQEEANFMPARRQSSTYHLTRRGWILSDVPPPDRVESWTCVVERAGHSKRYVEWTCLWADPEIPEGERDRLRWSFPEPLAGLRDAVA